VVTIGTVAATLGMVQIPALAPYLHVVPLHGTDLAAAALASLVVAALSLLTNRSAGRRALATRRSRAPARGTP
jgi:hypothetical protein